jgi:hypothetical protein
VKRSAVLSARRRPGRIVGGVLVAILGTLLAITACSNQGEGERCEELNNNDDCDTSAGLICYPAAQLGSGLNSARCCPADRSKATHPVCRGVITVGGDATTTADTGPTPTNDASSTSDASDAADGSDSADAADAADADGG